MIIDRMARSNSRTFTDIDLIPKIARSEDDKAKHALSYTYLDLFKTRQIAVLTMSLCFVWFTVSEIYYGVVVMVNTFTGDLYVNAIISALTVYPVQLLAIPLFTW